MRSCMWGNRPDKSQETKLLWVTLTYKVDRNTNSEDVEETNEDGRRTGRGPDVSFNQLHYYESEPATTETESGLTLSITHSKAIPHSSLSSVNPWVKARKSYFADQDAQIDEMKPIIAFALNQANIRKVPTFALVRGSYNMTETQIVGLDNMPGTSAILIYATKPKESGRRRQSR